jgi:hypothetical protein
MARLRVGYWTRSGHQPGGVSALTRPIIRGCLDINTWSAEALRMAAATILTVLTARYLGQRGETLTFGLIGAIPAAVCSWLSGLMEAPMREQA